jgi:copper chaperone CopZ
MNAFEKWTRGLGLLRWSIPTIAVVTALAGANVGFASVSSARARVVSEAMPAAANVETLFEVRGMTCPTCAVTVRTAARAVPGVFAARVSKDEQRAWVTYDPSRVTADAIAAAITKAGYPAKPLP